MDKNNPTQKRSARDWPKPLLFALLLLALLASAWFFPLADLLQQALARIESLGPFGPVGLGVVYIVACVLMFPCSILTIGAGALFGVTIGFATVSLAATAGATAAFLIGRYFARDFVAQKVKSSPRFHAIDRAVAGSGWKIVALLRLSPLFPFNLLNYGLGITAVSLRDYVLASWLGMMPGTLLYVYIGSLAGSIASLSSANRTRTPLEWTLYIFGLAVTIVATIYVTRIARQALANSIASSEQNP